MNESVSTKQSSAKTAKSLTGLVVSDNMDKTVTVLIERKVKHPIYQKYIRRSNKFMAHDEENTCRKGDIVTITPCRPLSKNKSWQLQAIVRRPE
ncbi:MAG: 30S ribosomal protein S17 [Candidatus Porifericomitaceae bacterium WSBS_2022_MAG_OTU9]